MKKPTYYGLIIILISCFILCSCKSKVDFQEKGKQARKEFSEKAKSQMGEEKADYLMQLYDKYVVVDDDSITVKIEASSKKDLELKASIAVLIFQYIGKQFGIEKNELKTKESGNVTGSTDEVKWSISFGEMDFKFKVEAK